MIELKKKSDCCGCTGCKAICPVGAISMLQDEEGFFYPVVSREKCIQCGLCELACPIQQRDNIKKTNIKKAYVLRVKDKETLQDSTSGGFFTPLAKYYLEIGAKIYACTINSDKEIVHDKINDFEDIKKSRGSKYVQSNLKNCLQDIKKDLDTENKVLFVGTPCQVNGLKLFLKHEYKNLLTVDMVCHGTPSPWLWKKYIEYIEAENNSKVTTSISFRNKTYGYHSSTMKIVFNNGKKYVGSARTDFMLKPFFSEISSRYSCYECPVKCNNRMSDFTIFDCWSAAQTAQIKDDDSGYTNVLVQSEKAIEIFNRIKGSYTYYEVPFEKAIKADGDMIYKSAIAHKDRDKFYQAIKKEGLYNAVQTYIPITPKDYFVENIKSTIYKMGILRLMKKILKY